MNLLELCNRTWEAIMANFNTLLFWVPAILLAPASLLAAYLYFSIKVELRLLARRSVSRAEHETRLTELVTELETLRVRLLAAESRPAQQDWAPQDGIQPPALNLNRRGQILRLHGKGRSTAEIASDLQISQGEVELLVKVHDWSAATAL
jgi:DNA-binding NarL/FixJ family response regulator